MKKTLLVACITASVLGGLQARADIAITSMDFGNNYAASGTILSGGGGSMASIDPFYMQPWFASQQTPIMDNTGSFAGESGQGAWDYTPDIAAMNAGQRAAGFFFSWSSGNDIPVLAIWNCNDDGSGDTCTGIGVPMQIGPFPFQEPAFNGYEIVPIPAAVWLMGSGLLGLVGVARRRHSG